MGEINSCDEASPNGSCNVSRHGVMSPALSNFPFSEMWKRTDEQRICVERPLPQFGMVSADVFDGKWSIHISKVWNFSLSIRDALTEL